MQNKDTKLVLWIGVKVLCRQLETSGSNKQDVWFIKEKPMTKLHLRLIEKMRMGPARWSKYIAHLENTPFPG